MIESVLFVQIKKFITLFLFCLYILADVRRDDCHVTQVWMNKNKNKNQFISTKWKHNIEETVIETF